jgi:hypothetical protein
MQLAVLQNEARAAVPGHLLNIIAVAPLAQDEQAQPRMEFITARDEPDNLNRVDSGVVDDEQIDGLYL